MRGLSSLERIILESLGKQRQNFDEILNQTGLHENVCFNVLQALVIRNIIKIDGTHYHLNECISPLMLEEFNGIGAKKAESLELIEAVVERETERVFRFQKVALDARDEKIFLAMLSNLDSFLADAHKKAQRSVPLKERKVVFWGVGEVNKLMQQILNGN